MKTKTHNNFKKIPLRRRLLVIPAVVLALSGILPLLGSGSVSAVTFESRKLTIGNPEASATTTYTFDLGGSSISGTTILSFDAQACTTAVGSCTTPTGFDQSTSTLPSQPTGMGSGGTWTVSTATAGHLRMSNATNTGSPTTPHIVFGSVQNTSTVGTFFMRVTTYSDASWTTAIDTGTVAASINSQLTVSATVAESLNFCVGTTGSANNTESAVIAANCAALSNNGVNLGVLSASSPSYSPVAVANGGNDNVGVTMLQTNAVNGASISYYAVQASTGTAHLGALRITGADCSGANPNGCIDSVGTTQTALSNGAEGFGLTVAGINHGTTDGNGTYSCTYAGANTCHLAPTAQYIGQGTAGSYVFGHSNGVAWDETGTAQTIATSSTVVDYEALVLHFGASQALLTPTGQYSVKTDFIATPSY